MVSLASTGVTVVNVEIVNPNPEEERE